MRPQTLELEGFMTYRELVTVDFRDADYFAFVGPTGAGKSSLIDAMIFALYGKIPRLDAKSVEPVIAKGKQEARVRFDFTVGDTAYTAARVVRRMGAGASTKEARLERGTETLAGDADGVTAEVERVLGLRFEEFTRCVVLPQGEFARFMHDKPADRGNLLTRLLDLGIYERIGQRANTIAATADTELTLWQKRLDEDFSYATPEALAAARALLARLSELRAAIEADEPRLEELRDAMRGARAEAEEARRAAAALSGLSMPADVTTLGAGLSEASASATATAEALAAAERATSEATAALDALGDRSPLAAAIHAHDQRASIQAELATTEEAIGEIERQLASAAERVLAAESSAREAEASVETARIANQAAVLARELVAGEPCPVCGQDVHEITQRHVPADVTVTEGALREARTALKEAENARAEHDKLLAAARAKASEKRATLAALAERIAGFPDAAAAREQLAALDAGEVALRQARASETTARASAAEARARVEAAEASLKDAWAALARARDGVATLSPPPLGREDLIADWQTLLAWAQERAGLMATAATAAEGRAAATETEGRSIRQRQEQACRDAGIEDVSDPRDDCVKGLTRATEAVGNIEEALAKADELRELVGSLRERATVSKSLGLHLRANAFEAWVLRQALTTLVEGATRIMLELSGGAYSLDIDKNRTFSVIDHRNADARRSAKTLSGGETFLASLALALAMSDRIAQLSAHSAVRLESIFLDEGFGALDAETLDVVRAAIEGLAARNRTVGIVTHVRTLAEEIPVRFEVRKGPSTSTVERVLA